jgi:hypothetical protein
MHATKHACIQACINLHECMLWRADVEVDEEWLARLRASQAAQQQQQQGGGGEEAVEDLEPEEMHAYKQR